MSDDEIDKPIPAGPRRSAWGGSWATIRDLEVLQTVVETRQATAAAVKLGISQPAVSRCLAQLEERSGRKLFRREGSALAPTADGLLIYHEAKPIFEALTRLRDFQWDGARDGVLSIAVPPTTAQCFLEPLVAQFLAGSPSLRVSLDIVTTPEVFDAVVEQRAALGIADIPTPNPGVQRIAFRRTTMVCVIAAGHPLAAKERIVPGDLHRQPYIAFTKRHALRGTLDRLLTRSGAKPKLAVETSNAISAVRLVGLGVGIAILNAFPIVLARDPRVVFRRFEPEIVNEAAFYISSDVPLPAVAQQFIDFVRATQPPDDGFSRPIA